MQTFVLMTKLPPELTSKLSQREQMGRNWLGQVKEKCPEVNFIAHYALLGQYDFMDIFEAPNAETAAKVSLISQKEGAAQAERTPLPSDDLRFGSSQHQIGREQRFDGNATDRSLPGGDTRPARKRLR